MRIARLLTCITLVVIFAGCVSENSARNLRLGMSKEEAIKVMGKPDAIVPEQAVEILNYHLTKITGDEANDDFGLQTKGFEVTPMSTTRVRSPRLYRLQLAEDRLVAFGISTELEPEKTILFQAIEFGAPDDNHWKSYGIKTKDLRLGMAKEELIKVLGQPDSFGANHQFEYLNFLRHSNGEGGERKFKLRAYIARFLNGRLERFWCEPF